MFAKDDLMQMKDACVSELEALGYDLSPIYDIDFSGRLSSNYAIAKLKKGFIRDRKTGEFKNIEIIILLEAALKDLDESWAEQIKILVMHECIHAVKPKDYPIRSMVDHGPEYDRIVQQAEKTYGYIGINSNEYHNFETVLPNIRESRKQKKKSKP